MLRVKCGCGAIFYEDIGRCPRCGRPRSTMAHTREDFPPPEPTEKQRAAQAVADAITTLSASGAGIGEPTRLSEYPSPHDPWTVLSEALAPHGFRVIADEREYASVGCGDREWPGRVLTYDRNLSRDVLALRWNMNGARFTVSDPWVDE